MRGRGTRKAPHIGKTGFTIFDFVGVTDFHGDDEGDIDGSPVRPPGRPPGPGEPRMLLTLDVDDHIDPESRDWLTLDETGRIVRTPEHDARDWCIHSASRSSGGRLDSPMKSRPSSASQTAMGSHCSVNGTPPRKPSAQPLPPEIEIRDRDR